MQYSVRRRPFQPAFYPLFTTSGDKEKPLYRLSNLFGKANYPTSSLASLFRKKGGQSVFGHALGRKASIQPVRLGYPIGKETYSNQAGCLSAIYNQGYR